MGNERHYNPVIYTRLLTLTQQADTSELLVYFRSLSHANFRTAGNILGERVLPQVSLDRFWSLFYLFLVYNPKAFLVTMLKSLLLRRNLQSESLDVLLRHPGFLVVSNYLNSNDRTVDKKKMVRMLIPEIDNPELGEYLFERFHMVSAESRLEVLLRGGSLCSAFLLFQTLRRLEHERELLVRCCHFLMKQGDALSFNLVSLFRLYFDLTEEVKGCFSLRLNPYELGRMEHSYEAFVKVMSELS